jgi:hypothetical protein
MIFLPCSQNVKGDGTMSKSHFKPGGYTRFGRKPAIAALLSVSMLLGAPTGSALANDIQNYTNHSSESEYDYKIVIPQRLTVSAIDQEKLENAIAYGILETISRVMADPDSQWAVLFKNGKLDIKQIVPIYDVEDNLAEVMLIYEEGYLIVDAENGALNQYSYGEIDANYFNQSDKIYVSGFEHFAVANGIVRDGSYKGMEISTLKRGVNNPNKIKKQTNTKWGIINKELRKSLIQSYGSNEGTSRRNYITDPYVWLSNYYGPGYSIVYNTGYSLNVPEINQNSSLYPEANDCAVISTLEILKYYQYPEITSSQLATAYNGMINSSYFSSSNGVYWYNNNELFKVAAESIGWQTQSTTNDPEDYINTNNYNYIYNKLYQIGPGYISMNQTPYGAHTVTFKGVKKYTVSWWSPQGAYYSNFEDFVQINDHWSITSGDAYLSIQGGNVTWYFTTIVVN